MGLPGRSTRRPRQGRKASLLVAARFGSWRGGHRELEDIDVLRTHFSIESKNRDSGRTDPNYGNASLLLREMLAALMIFSALFALVAAIGLTLFLIWFLLDRARQLQFGWMEKRGKGFARAALRLLPARSRV